LRAEVLAMLLWGPRLMPGGESGGLSISGMLAEMFWKLICAADGEVQGSDDSRPVQAKLDVESAVVTDVIAK
jgi:hypothetical protein